MQDKVIESMVPISGEMAKGAQKKKDRDNGMLVLGGIEQVLKQSRRFY